ncbi:hypothetical protein [Butyrivibrio sp. MB2005]|uniref:hypothetical protein n=1 Tax=Butyrivibrio sp. MB2005 TaxID=1280678 RepID=UPI00040AAD21|nr:hypothetical protein [Butyrivibrio sp. MB2005]
MSKIETVYDVVFEIYGLKQASKPTKEKIRSLVKRHLEKNYAGKTWNELSKIEKDAFVYITIRQKILDKYVDASKHNKINKRIDDYLKNQFSILESDLALRKHNSIIGAIYEQYYNPDDTESVKREKYQLLCHAIHNKNAKAPTPSFDDWCNNPLRPYDYIRTYEESDFYEEDDTIEATQAEIDHVILQTLLKEYSSNSNSFIDTDKIKECLTFLKNVPFDVSDNELLDKYDPTINLPPEEQERIIQANRRYFAYLKMLKDLDFIKKS